MSRYKHGLIVAIALLTVVGMTAVFAAPTGAQLTTGDGLSPTVDSVTASSADAAANDSNDHPACDNPGEADNNSANCQDKDEEEEDDDDEEDDEENEEGEDGDGAGTCETGGAAQNATVANQAFGTENESGPISSQIHANEGQFQNGEPIAHEVSCGVATIDNNAPSNGSSGGNQSNPAEDVIGAIEDNAPGNGSGGDGNQSNPAEDVIGAIGDNAPGNDSEDGSGDDGETGTCETGGAAQNATVANQAFGTENESGPISSQIHANEGQFQNGEPIAHEVSCGVATADNNAP